MSLPRLSRQRGLSLTECVVAMGVVGGTLHLALPAVDETIQSSRLAGASQALLVDLSLARSEALKSNRRAAMCKSPDGAACTRAGGWEQGWIVFHDENNNGLVEPGEDVIRRHEALPAGLRARGNQPIAHYVSYTPLGTTKYVGGGFQAGTLTVCRVSAAPTASRQVVINSVGRPRTQRSQLAECPP